MSHFTKMKLGDPRYRGDLVTFIPSEDDQVEVQKHHHMTVEQQRRGVSTRPRIFYALPAPARVHELFAAAGFQEAAEPAQNVLAWGPCPNAG